VRVANTLTTIWDRPTWSIFRRYILGNRPLWFFVVFGALTTYILWPFYPDEAGLRNEWVGNIAVEGFGFLMDIVLFGLLWSVFDVYRERRTKIRGYQDELVDFMPWEGQEGVLRKAGIIKRLNELQASLPRLYGIHLEGAGLVRANLKGAYLVEANLKGAKLSLANLVGARLFKADLEGASLVGATLKGANLKYTNLECADSRGANLKDADLLGANLKGADLLGANLKGADLSNAHLEGAALRWANLEGVKQLTWEQLKEAKTDDETILPAYLKENAPESYKGKFAGEKGE